MIIIIIYMYKKKCRGQTAAVFAEGAARLALLPKKGQLWAAPQAAS